MWTGRMRQRSYKVDLSSAFIVLTHTRGAQIWITQFYRQITPCLPLPRKRLPDGATTDCRGRHLTAAYCSFFSASAWSAAVELTTTDCPWCIIDTDSVLRAIEDFSVSQSLWDIIIAPL